MIIKKKLSATWFPFFEKKANFFFLNLLLQGEQKGEQ